jgi:hypothetical protein
MNKKEISIKEVINFLRKKVVEVNQVRTSQYPKHLPSEDDLIAAKKYIQELIDFWLSHQSHVLTTKMMYIDGELSEEIIKEYWDVLKNINVEEERKKLIEKKEARKKPPCQRNVLDECRAHDDWPRGHI